MVWSPGRLCGRTSLGMTTSPRPMCEGARICEYGMTIPLPCYQPFEGRRRCRATGLSCVPTVDPAHKWTKQEPVYIRLPNSDRSADRSAAFNRLGLTQEIGSACEEGTFLLPGQAIGPILWNNFTKSKVQTSMKKC